MRTTPALRLLCIIPLFSLILVSGCILSPEEDLTPPDPTEIFKPLTDKENVIHNLVQSYKYTNFAKYSELLHTDYIWYNQPEDFASGEVDEEFYGKNRDETITQKIFNAVNGQSDDPELIIDKLEFTIQPGSWTQITELGGTPCEDCWETTRVYYIRVDFKTISKVGNDLVKYVVVPVTEDGKKLYKLFYGYDILN